MTRGGWCSAVEHRYRLASGAIAARDRARDGTRIVCVRGLPSKEQRIADRCAQCPRGYATAGATETVGAARVHVVRKVMVPDGAGERRYRFASGRASKDAKLVSARRSRCATDSWASRSAFGPPAQTVHCMKRSFSADQTVSKRALRAPLPPAALRVCRCLPARGRRSARPCPRPARRRRNACSLPALGMSLNEAPDRCQGWWLERNIVATAPNLP